MAEELKNKGNAALGAGNTEEAIRCYSEAIKLNPVKEYYSNRSLAYTKVGKFNEALEDAEKCVIADPNWSKGYQRKGFALHNLRRFKEAVDSFKRGIEIEPNNDQMKTGLSEAEKLAAWEEEQKKRENQVKDRLSQLHKLFEGDPLGQCRLMPEVKHLVDDVEFVKKVAEIQEDPNKLQQYLNDERIIQFISVATQYQHLSKLSDKERAELFQKQEEMRLRAEKAEEEERDRRRKEEQKRKEEEERRRRLEEEASMTSEQRKAVQLKEEGNKLYNNKNYEEALKLYQQAQECDPQNILYFNNIAATFLELKEYDKCIEICRRGEEIGRENRASFENIGKALQRLGTAYFKKGDYANAIENYKKSLMEHRDPRTLTLLRQVEKLAEEKAIQGYINPELSAKAKDEGNELFKLGRYPEAIEKYTEAIKRDPNNHVIYTNRATAYTKLKAYSEALKDCDKCLELNPSFVKAYLKKGNVYFLTKQYQKSIEVYEKALSIEPNNEEIRMAMEKSVIEITKGQDPNTVKKNIEKNPELQAILRDPIMQEVLLTIQNGQPINHYLKDPKIKSNIEKLMLAGVIGSAPGGKHHH